MNLDEVTEAVLEELGFREPGRALRILNSLPGQGVTDDDIGELLPTLFGALRGSPDPDRALNNLERWFSTVTSRYTHVQLLLRHPTALSIFLNVCGVSQFFSDILVRNPEYFEILANPGVRGLARSAASIYAELAAFCDRIVRVELKLEGLRRYKQREVLRIGTRDILGLADMPTTAREFSDLADASIQVCCRIALAQAREAGYAPNVRMAVIGMGKLGGQELNYSSDVDLMFVCDDPEEGDSQASRVLPSAIRLAELTVNHLSRNLQNGHLFRVDMRLRPEGRFGPLVRTLSSYRAYYESWAEPWELQALIKARCVAGDMRLGQHFIEMTRPFVYRRIPSGEVLRDIRHNKERMERKCEVEGQAHTNLKTGFGGIRDIEFTVQLLQLQHGGAKPMVRTPTTLDAIARLRRIGALNAQQARDFSDDYQFLRTVEHRLQILADRQTQTLPTDPDERRLLARRLGYPDTEAFDREYEVRTRRVRRHFEALFLAGAPQADPADEWRALLEAVDTAAGKEALVSRLADLGFREPERAHSFLSSAVVGTRYGMPTAEERNILVAFGGQLLLACSQTGDPDAALAGVEALVAASPNAAAVLRMLARSPDLTERLCRLGAGSPPLMRSLARNLEWLDLLVSEEMLDPAPKSVDASLAELRGRLPRPGKQASEGIAPRFWDALALYIRRERLRIGARDLWGEIGIAGVGRELSGLADAVLQALLDEARRVVERDAPEEARVALATVAIMGLGKLGGEELGYGSDWDILVAYRLAEGASSRAAHDAANALVELILSAGQELRTRDAAVEVDARLRPEGRFGALARPVAEYEAYYEREALTWERQVLTRARWAAGDAETGRGYMEAVARVIYSAPLPDDRAAEIQAMKRRMETERLKLEDRTRDIKLGHGGLSDIEFTAQFWQLRVGAEHPRVRVACTSEALYALADCGALRDPDAARLADAHALLSEVRNRLALLGVASTDRLPDDERRLHALAVGLGEPGGAEGHPEDLIVATLAARMAETRSIVDRVFYGG